MNNVLMWSVRVFSSSSFSFFFFFGNRISASLFFSGQSSGHVNDLTTEQVLGLAGMGAEFNWDLGEKVLQVFQKKRYYYDKPIIVYNQYYVHTVIYSC